MGSGSSTTAAGGTGSIDSTCEVTCPLFYNGMPSKLVVPEGVLPHVDQRKVLKGCAARVTMLRRALVAPASSSAKSTSTSPVASFLTGGPNGYSHTISLGEMCLSAPYLITFTVDADGRLAPSDGDGARGTPTTSGATGIKGFNFKKNSDEMKGAAPQGPQSTHHDKDKQASSPTSSTRGEPQSPSKESATAKPELPTANAHSVPIAVLLNPGSDGRPRLNTAVSSGHSSTTASVNGESPLPPSAVPVHSVLVKDSKLLVRENSLRKDAVLGGSARGPGLGLKKRSSKRLARLQVPHRTRYCFYNDSLTHEAQITFTILYRQSEDALRATKVICLPTPHVASTTGARPADALNSASRTYVEVRENGSTVNPQLFTSLLRPPTTPEEKAAHASIRPASKGGAASQVVIVLAPGATVAAVESSLLLGYHVECSMVPFDEKKSLAVMGRYASPEQVQSQLVPSANAAAVADVEMALVKADSKNKAQDIAKNKPIKLVLGFVTQYVREDTTDADGWSDPSPPTGAGSLTTLPPPPPPQQHARAALEKHLADVPYVTMSGGKGSGPRTAAGTKAPPETPAEGHPTGSSAPTVVKGAAAPAPSSKSVPVQQQQQQPILSARGPAPGAPARGSNPDVGGGVPNRIPAPISGWANPTLNPSKLAPEIEVRELNSSKLSLSTGRTPRLAEPPSPTRSPLGAQPRLSTAPSSSAFSGPRKSAGGTSPVVPHPPQQRHLVGSAPNSMSTRNSTAALADVLKPSTHTGNDRLAASPDTVELKRLSAPALPKPPAPTEPVHRRDQVARSSSSQSRSASDLGISF